MTKIIQLDQLSGGQLYSLKLTADTIGYLKKASRPKLVVKNGDIFIRLEDRLLPCSKTKESPNLNIFNIEDITAVYKGNVDTRLQIVTDLKRIKQLTRKLALSTRSPKFKDVDYIKNLEQKFALTNDSIEESHLKFISVLCLGPTNIQKLGELNFKAPLLTEMINIYCSKYAYSVRFNSTIDEYVNGREYSDEYDLVLKDKVYKDLRPNGLFDKEELDIIYNNIYNSLTRLGYSETHPIRKKISDKAILFKTNLGINENSVKVANKSEKTPGTPKYNSESGIASKLSNNKSNIIKVENKRIKKRSYDSTSPSSIDSDYDVDVEALASKFKFKYQEYAKLYSDLKDRKATNKDKQDLTRLYEMHNYLKQIKVELTKINSERVGIIHKKVKRSP